MTDFKVLPLWKSHYSIGKSILTLENSEKKPHSPVSIISLAKEAGLGELVLVEDNFSSFLEAFKNAKAAKMKLIYGIRMFVTESLADMTPASVCKRSKIIIFIRNTEGYGDLCRIWSLAASQGLFSGVSQQAKVPHIDYPTLKKLWTKNLQLAVPFYDSFLYMNTLSCGSCVPDFSSIEPVFFREDNNMPFDQFLQTRLTEYLATNKYQEIAAKSIFYENRDDFIAYLTARCINNRSTLENPDLDHLCSDDFCFEAWKEAANV
jgi:DNA polymerase III alpha subunit